MSILSILTDKNPLLRKTSITIKSIDNEVKKLAYDMIDTMQKNEGVGLAAPQVGILKRLIVVIWHSTLKKEPLIMINPEITIHSHAEIIMEEGCLSLPNVFAEVPRSASIQIEFQDIEGKKQTLRANKLNARIIQHEVDHLDGILFPERAVQHNSILTHR